MDDHLTEDTIDKNEQVFFSALCWPGLGPFRGGLAKLQGFTENDLLMKIIGANNVQVQQDCWWSTQDDLCPPAGPHASLAMLVATTCCVSDNNGE